MKKTILTLALAALCGSAISAEVIYRPQPKEWDLLVDGAKFRDRFLPLPKGKLPSKKDWGADGVRNRYIDNGIEDNVISYWGGNIIFDEESQLYHMFVCGWPENNPDGHFGWPLSTVYHATCDNPIGPFKVIQTLGEGHNPEILRAKDGTWMVYHVTRKGDRADYALNTNYFSSESLNGPWVRKSLPLDLRDREFMLGGGTWYSNMSFVKREDGSILMLSRMGSIWISEDGESPYHMVTERSVYPLVAGNYEDPVLWKDSVQYNIIVHDWLGRTAFYLRSKDGLHWEQEDGTAYTPGVIYHEDGEVEEWVKYERIRLLQDKQGRVMQTNLAVIDTLKNLDLPNDKYSSKNVSIPMNRGVILTVLNNSYPTRKTKTIKVKISGEDTFNLNEIDLSSLRFGTAKEVNYGRGAVALSSEMEGKDMIVTFEAKNHCLSHEEFAAKIIGKRKGGEMLFGYARLPWINYICPMVSARKPSFKDGKVNIVVENFGQVRSEPTVLLLCAYNEAGAEEEIGNVVVPSIDPYKSTTLEFTIDKHIKGDDSLPVVVKILDRSYTPSFFSTTL